MSNEFLPGAVVRDVTSSAGLTYRIFIWAPPADDARKRPVVYLLDGNGSFPIAVAAAALQSRRPERTGVQPALIVGIGYPTDQWLDPERRTYDFTPALPAAALPQRPDHGGWSRTGGADEFLDFVAAELQPALEAEFNIDSDRRALFGHSFGGLFVLHSLFTRPDLFHSYAAASPSIWFCGDHLSGAKQRFIGRRAPARRLLITVGSLEQAEGHAGDGSRPDYDLWIRRNRMVDNARALAGELAAIGRDRLDVTFSEFADENHASVLPAAISRMLRFVFAPAG